METVQGPGGASPETPCQASRAEEREAHRCELDTGGWGLDDQHSPPGRRCLTRVEDEGLAIVYTDKLLNPQQMRNLSALLMQEAAQMEMVTRA